MSKIITAMTSIAMLLPFLFACNGNHGETINQNSVETSNPVTSETEIIQEENFNIDIMVRQGSSSKNHYASKGQFPVFNGGNGLTAVVNMSPELQNQFGGKTITVEAILIKGKEVLVQHSYDFEYGGSYRLDMFLVPPVTGYPNESWTGKYAKAFSILPAGKHEMILKVMVSNGSEKVAAGIGKLTYDNKGGNADYAAQAAQIQEKTGKSEDELYSDFAEAHGASNIDESKYSSLQPKKMVSIKVVNNCGNNSRPFMYGNSDWITLDGGNGSRSIQVEAGAKIYRSDNGSPREVATIGEGDEGRTVYLCL